MVLKKPVISVISVIHKTGAIESIRSMKLDPVLSAKILALADASGGKPIDAGLLRDEKPVAQVLAELHDLEKPKRSKYGNTKIEADGRTFDSKKEHRRWLELRDEQAAGNISELRHQVEFPIEVNGIEVCRYVADYTYRRSGRLVVEDVKSPATRKIAVYRLKVKLMASLGIEVQEV